MEPAPSSARGIGAMVASVIAPGAGHFVIGRWERGAVWVGANLFLAVATFVGYRTHPPLLVIGGLLGFLVWAASLVDTWRTKPGRFPRPMIAWAAFAAVVIADQIPGLAIGTPDAAAFKIPSGSMQPTLKIGDHVFVDRSAYATKAPERGDVVVYEMPGDRSKKFAKRIAGIPGDTLEIKDGVLIVNGEAQARAEKGSVEAYGAGCESVSLERFEETLGGTTHSLLQHGPRGWSGGPWTVPEGRFFMLGDDRDNSNDSSRANYTVPLDHITGRVSFVWFSWDTCKGHVRTKRLGDVIR